MVSSYVYTNHKTKTTTKRPPEVFEISSKQTEESEQEQEQETSISIANKRFWRRYSYYATFHIFTENDDSDDDSDDDKDEDAECERDLSRSIPN